MKKIEAIMGEEFAALLKEAAVTVMERNVSHQAISGSEAIREYGITRTHLRKIRATHLPGLSKPKYLRKHICEFMRSKTEL